MRDGSATGIDTVLENQWSVLRRWVQRPEVRTALDAPSVLDGWTVRDLLAHVGRSFTTLTTLSPTQAPPQSLHAYLRSYAPAAEEIAAGTRTLATELGDDVHLEVDRLAREGLAALSSLTAEVVQAPRGPIRRNDFVTTRLLELVVHADDLARSVGLPVDDALTHEAVRLVGEALASAYVERSGRAAPSDGRTTMEWVRCAAGRSPSDDEHLPLV